MSMPISKLAPGAAMAAILALSGCEDPAPATATEIAAEDDKIEVVECAIGEGSQFGPDCTVEQVDPAEPDAAPVLIVRHPDGAFRRFEQLDDGRGLQAADGADEVSLSLDGDMLLVAVAGDRYRFAANVSRRAGQADAQPDDVAAE